MAIVLTLGGEVTQIIYAYGPQSERPDTEKVCFCNKMASEWDLESSGEIINFSRDFNGYVRK